MWVEKGGKINHNFSRGARNGGHFKTPAKVLSYSVIKLFFGIIGKIVPASFCHAKKSEILFCAQRNYYPASLHHLAPTGNSLFE